MGLISEVFLLPFAPVRGSGWVIRQVLQEAERIYYDPATIRGWLEVFLTRFMANQFKRTAMPNGPKIGSGGSLSPRGDWRAPSDAPSTAWLDALD